MGIVGAGKWPILNFLLKYKSEQKALSFRGATTWNELALDVKQAPSLSIF